MKKQAKEKPKLLSAKNSMKKRTQGEADKLKITLGPSLKSMDSIGIITMIIGYYYFIIFCFTFSFAFCLSYHTHQAVRVFHRPSRLLNDRLIHPTDLYCVVFFYSSLVVFVKFIIGLSIVCLVKA